MSRVDELAGLLREIRAEHEASGPLDSGGAVELEPLDLERPGTPPLLDLALAELERVHRVELACLLREAAREPLGLARSPRPVQRAGLEEALTCAELDGLRLSPAVLGPARRWLSGEDVPPVQLARASLRLDECLEGRRLLACILLREGHGRRASSLLASSLLGLGRMEGALRETRRELTEMLASAQETAGEADRARRLTTLIRGEDSP